MEKKECDVDDAGSKVEDEGEYGRTKKGPKRLSQPREDSRHRRLSLKIS